MEKKTLTMVYIIMALVFGACLIAGTIYDLPIAESLYSGDSIASDTISFIAF